MATDSSLVGLPERVVRAIEERYGLGHATSRGRLAGGYANDIYVVDADGAPLVVRVQRRPVDVAGLGWEHRLLRLLAPRAPEVIPPLPARDGSTFFLDGEDAVAVFPHVDAKPAERWFDRTAAAYALASFHRAGRDLALPPRPGLTQLASLRDGISSGRYFAAIGPRANAMPPELAARTAEIERALEWTLAFVEEAAERSPTTAPIHGDVFRGNMLVRDGRVVALVDWEEANVDWLAYELANAMWEFCKQGDLVLDHAAAERFVAEYRGAGGPVPAAEDELLVPLVRVRRILELVRAPYDRHVDWNYQLCNLQAFHGLA